MDTMQIAGMIDHTLLKPEATREQIVRLCEEAKQHRFASVCVNPYWVPAAARELDGSGVMVATVIGFPLGAASTRTKAFEAADAIEAGASEIDMVVNIGALKSGDIGTVTADIRAVVAACEGKAKVKVIIETGLLTDEEKVAASKASLEAGADFVKTSTGFGHGGATVADIALMRRTVGPDMGIKASGGVRDLAFARELIEAGATRLGTSSGAAIIAGGSAQGY